jgi:hypothetical protein
MAEVSSSSQNDDQRARIFNGAEKALAVLKDAGLTKQEAFAAIATMQAVLIGHSLMDRTQAKQAMAYVEKTTRTLLPEMLEQGREQAKARSN